MWRAGDDMNESGVGSDWEIKIRKQLLNHVSIYYLSDPWEGTFKIWIILTCGPWNGCA